jgi:hypothetical protein
MDNLERFSTARAADFVRAGIIGPGIRIVP